MKEPIIVFIYGRDGKIKVLTHNEANESHKELIADGYIHSSTIDIRMFLEQLYNEMPKDEVLNSIESLYIDSKITLR